MNKTTGWVVAVGMMAVSAVIATIALVAGIAVGVFIADLFGKVSSDRACIAALAELRAEHAANIGGPELHAVEIITDRYCGQIGS